MEKRSYSCESIAKQFKDRHISNSLRDSFGIIKKDSKDTNEWKKKPVNQDGTLRVSNSSYVYNSKDNRSLGT